VSPGPGSGDWYRARLPLEDADVVTARGLYLLGRECDLEAAENRAGLVGRGHAAALRAEAAQVELAGIIDELDYRGVDLHAAARRVR